MYEANVSAVVAYCSRRLGRQDAEDAAAEVFAVAWRKLDAVPGDASLPWLYGVARNVVANHQRAARRTLRLRARLRSVGSDDVEGPEVMMVVNQEHAALHEALKRLPARDQEILRLVEWERLDRAVVAEMFGVTPNAINKRMSRAYGRLGRVLGRRSRRSSAAMPAGERGEA